MGVLAEFLKEKSQELSSRRDSNKSVRDEWVNAVNEKMTEIESWLREEDQEHLLDIIVEDVEGREQGVGHYVARGLRVRLEAHEVRIYPVAPLQRRGVHLGLVDEP